MATELTITTTTTTIVFTPTSQESSRERSLERSTTAPEERSLLRTRSVSPGSFKTTPVPSLPVPRLFLNDLAASESCVKRVRRPGSASERRHIEPLKSSPALKVVRVPLSSFLSFIDIPVLPYPEWEKQLKDQVVKIVGETIPFPEEIKTSIATVYTHALECSGILQRVAKAAELLSELEEHQFLDDFSQEANPTQFWKRYKKLEKPQGKLLYEIMEKEKGWILLQKAGEDKGEVIKNKLMAQIAVSPLERKRAALLRTKFSFKQGFEELGMSIRPCGAKSIMTPGTYFPNPGEFESAFRSFYSDAPLPENSICFNGENWMIPNYKKAGIFQETDRPHYFFEWLVAHIQDKMQLSSALPVEEQCKVFQEAVLLERKEEKKLKSSIIKCLKGAFKEHTETAKFSLFFERMKKETALSDFFNRMRPYESLIRTLLLNDPDFKSKNGETIADLLIDFYQCIHNLQRKRELIPTLPLLHAMAYERFSACWWFFRLVLCPGLHPNNFVEHRLILGRDVLARYDIQADKGEFCVNHIKPFHIVKENKTKASFLVHYKVGGNLNVFDYDTDLELKDFKFSADCSEEERNSIMDQFHLDFEDTPWGEFLERGEI